MILTSQNEPRKQFNSITQLQHKVTQSARLTQCIKNFIKYTLFTHILPTLVLHHGYHILFFQSTFTSKYMNNKPSQWKITQQSQCKTSYTYIYTYSLLTICTHTIFQTSDTERMAYVKQTFLTTKQCVYNSNRLANNR